SAQEREGARAGFVEPAERSVLARRHTGRDPGEEPAVIFDEPFIAVDDEVARPRADPDERPPWPVVTHRYRIAAVEYDEPKSVTELVPPRDAQEEPLDVSRREDVPIPISRRPGVDRRKHVQLALAARGLVSAV